MLKVRLNDDKSGYGKSHPVLMTLREVRFALTANEARQLAIDLDGAAQQAEPEPKRINRILWSCGPCEIQHCCVDDLFYVKDKGTGEVVARVDWLYEAVEAVHAYVKANRRAH
jgi:hypothetical protein